MRGDRSVVGLRQAGSVVAAGKTQSVDVNGKRAQRIELTLLFTRIQVCFRTQKQSVADLARRGLLPRLFSGNSVLPPVANRVAVKPGVTTPPDPLNTSLF